MNITPDFSESADFTPVMPGVYKTRVIGVEAKTSKAGNAYLNWKLQIFGAEGDLAKMNNRPLFAMTMTSGSAAGRLRDFAKACKKPIESGKAFSTDDYMGCELQVMAEKKLMQDGS